MLTLQMGGKIYQWGGKRSEKALVPVALLRSHPWANDTRGTPFVGL